MRVWQQNEGHILCVRMPKRGFGGGGVMYAAWMPKRNNGEGGGLRTDCKRNSRPVWRMADKE